MKILITGGTGFIGPHIVRAFVDAGHDVTLFNRGNRNTLFPDLAALIGDRLEGDLTALDGTDWDAAVDTSAYIPRVVSQLLETVKTRRYVFISSISAYAHPGTIGLREDAELSTLNEETEKVTDEHYGALKAQCEWAATKKLGRHTTVIRPGLIVGPGDTTDRFTWWPVRFAHGGKLLCPGDGSHPLQVIDVRDLAAFIHHVVAADISGTFNATGPLPPITIHDLVDACMTIAGPDAKPVWVNWETLEKLDVGEWTDLPAVVSPRGEAVGFGAIDVSRAVEAGLTFRPLAQTVADTFDWWKSERNDELKAGLTAEREAEILDRAAG